MPFTCHMSADCSPLCCRGDVDVSAVCQYQIADVKKVFEGAYNEFREASQRWGRFTGVVPSPRPGSVRTTRGTRGSGDEARRENFPLKLQRSTL